MGLKRIDREVVNVEDAIQQSCQILSDMTNMTSGAIGPDASSQRLEHIKLFPIDERNAVCVFITDSGHTETKNFHFDEDIPFKDIETCTDILNQRLKGTPITELAEKMESIKPDLSSVIQRHEMLFTAFVKFHVTYQSLLNISYQHVHSRGLIVLYRKAVTEYRSKYFF